MVEQTKVVEESFEEPSKLLSAAARIRRILNLDSKRCPYTTSLVYTYSVSRSQGHLFCPMKIGPISGMAMALYPSIIATQGLSWDHPRIGQISGMALYPQTLQAGCTLSVPFRI